MQAAERADDAHARTAQWPIYLRPAELPTVVCFQDSQRERERSDDGSLVVMLSPWESRPWSHRRRSPSGGPTALIWRPRAVGAGVSELILI